MGGGDRGGGRGDTHLLHLLLRLERLLLRIIELRKAVKRCVVEARAGGSRRAPLR
jgi:hypothetical protein